jgi:heme a synthase
MRATLERLSQRTSGYTVTPRQFLVLAYVALGALTLIVFTGAAVRLTGSGLGCPTWPKCYGNLYPPLSSHAVIEFGNRTLTVPVSIAAGLAWLGALRRRPYRRDLAWLAGLLPLGVVAQAILGGLTVRGALDYGWVMAHFALSMLVLVAAIALVGRARTSPDLDLAAAERPAGGGDAGGRGAAARGAGARTAKGRRAAAARPAEARPAEARPAEARVAGARGAAGAGIGDRDRVLVRWTRGLVGLAALTIFAGTAATAAGPHAGGSPGQKINRLDFDGKGTMDFVIHRHGEIAFAFGLVAVLTWYLARRRGAGQSLRQALTAVCVLLAVQGLVGLDQYETHLPTELVWVHVVLATLTWLATLWAALVAGRRPAQSATIAPLEAPARALQDGPSRPHAELIPGN